MVNLNLITNLALRQGQLPDSISLPMDRLPLMAAYRGVEMLLYLRIKERLHWEVTERVEKDLNRLVLND